MALSIPGTSYFSVTYEQSASSDPKRGRCRAKEGVKPSLGRLGSWADGDSSTVLLNLRGWLAKSASLRGTAGMDLHQDYLAL